MPEIASTFSNSRGLTLVFASMFLFSFGMISHNAFAAQMIATISVGTAPTGVGINPTTNEIYVANSGSSSISVIDGATNNIISTIPIESQARDVSVNPVTNMIYVVEGKQEIAVINGATHTLQQTLTLQCQCDSGSYAEGVAVDPRTNIVYATVHSTEHFGTVYDAGGSVVFINGTTNAQIGEVDVVGWTRGVAINEFTNKVYFTAYAAPYTNYNFIYAMDNSKNSVSKISLPNNPGHVATNPLTNMVYAAETQDGKVAVIDGSTDTLLKEIPVRSGPFGVAVNPNTNIIFVANNGNNTVSIMNGSSNQLLQTISVGASPNLIDVNPRTNRIYVANENSNTVSVIQGNSSNFAIPSAPQNLQATVSNFQVSLSWSPPGNNGGSAITNYNIYRGTSSGSEFLFAQIGNLTSYIDTAVTKGQVYYYKVEAINSAGGESSQSNEASVTIPSTPPSAPQNFAAGGENTQVVLEWSTPNNGGSAITNYNIYKSTTSGTETLLTTVGNVNSYTDTGLTNGQTYYYKVSAVNSLGESPQSNEASAVPKEAYTILHDDYSSSAGWTQVGTQITVNDPQFPGVVQYNSESGGGGSTEERVYKQLPSSLPIGNWVAEFNYKFISSSIPAAFIFTLTGNSNDPEKQPISNDLRVYHGPGADNLLIVGTGGSSPTIPISPNTQYYVRLQKMPTLVELSVFSDIHRTVQVPGSPVFLNIASTDYNNLNFLQHDGCWSCGPARILTAQVTNTTIYAGKGTFPSPTAPSAPQNLQATGGNAQGSLSWSAPGNNGGSSITNYKIYRGTSSGSEALLTQIGNVTSYTDTGLTNGQTYYYKVTAVNSIGESPQSNEASAIPSAPPPPAQVTVSVKSVDLSGNPITGLWTVIRTPSGTTVSSGFTPVSFTVTSGNSYVVHVGNYQSDVFNHWNDGSTSSYYTITPTQNVILTAYYSTGTTPPPSTVPSAPQNLQASAGNTQVSLSWSAPSSNGGSAITNYKIYRGTSSGTETLLTTVGNVLSYTDGTVTNGQAYFYKVSAVNSVGESAQSNEASAKPSAPPPTTTAVITVQAVDSSGTVLHMYTLLKTSAGVTLTTGFTPVGFTVNTNTDYLVKVSNYSTHVFQHWQDQPSNTNQVRPINISQDTTIVAVFS